MNLGMRFTDGAFSRLKLVSLVQETSKLQLLFVCVCVCGVCVSVCLSMFISLKGCVFKIKIYLFISLYYTTV